MTNRIGKNIYTLRKNLGLTQEELAKLVNVSFQAVSKWENGNTTPDISTLPLLANILHCSIDSLLGYAAQQHKITEYEERYKMGGYYWGTQPSAMCYEIMKLCPPLKPLRLLDVACGEGTRCVSQETDTMLPPSTRRPPVLKRHGGLRIRPERKSIFFRQI